MTLGSVVTAPAPVGLVVRRRGKGQGAGGAY